MNLFRSDTTKGFTLVELLIVISIISLLAAIGYPAYTEQVNSSQRSDGKTALLELSAQLERCFTEFNAYNNTSCPVVSSVSGTPTVSATSDEGFYAISSTTLSQTAFTLLATAQGGQTDDTSCGNLSLTHTGVKDASGPKGTECW